MKTLQILFIAAVLSFGFSSLSQAQNTGSIRGTVIDAYSNETLPGASVYIKTGNNLIGATSDLHGVFTIKPLQPGSYDVHITYIGYGEQIVASVKVNADQISFLKTIKMVPGITIPVTNIYPDPLINPDGGIDKIIRAKDIEDLPVSNNILKIITALSSDIIASDNERDFSFRGARTGDATMIVDGIMIRGSEPNLPSGSIASIVVYSGGIPAKYGDTTGGVVVIQTKSYFEWEAERKMNGSR